MKIEHLPSRSDARVSVVTLGTAAERGLSDDELLRICANLQGIKYNHVTDRYALVGQDFGPEAKGEVFRQSPGRALVGVRE